MLIKLNLVDIHGKPAKKDVQLGESKKDYWIPAHIVVFVEQHTENPLLCAITTNIMTNQGPLVLSVMDRPEDVALRVNEALRGAKEAAVARLAS